MFRYYFYVLLMLCFWSESKAQAPDVFSTDQPDLIESGLNQKAAFAFKTQQPARNIQDWENRKKELRSMVLEKTGADRFPDLPLEYHETGSHTRNGVTVKNIYFQTRPGVYATANLYIPDGQGPFPAVVTMMGHSSNGRLYDVYQAIGQSLAHNGYVSLHMDPWGAGERTTVHGEFQYHGANLGASLFDVGESLLGMQLTDNMRGVDLLCTLPYVDSEKIGATGASGGGNQTMWLAAMDDRIKAAMPVVSVGTFQSYIMGSNCVCETLVDGLTFTEEGEILGLVAPRALKLVNAGKDSNKAFFPDQMKRSFTNAQPIFNFYKAKENLAYQVFDMTHGYHPEARAALLGWMDLHLMNTGDGKPRPEGELGSLEDSELMTFEAGKRDDQVTNTADFCTHSGQDLKEGLLSSNNIDARAKKDKLSALLGLKKDLNLVNAHHFGTSGDWDLYGLELSEDYLIPVVVRMASQNSSEFVIIADSGGKSKVDQSLIDDYIKAGKNIVLVDFWGLGESSSPEGERLDGSHLPRFHTLSRSLLWLGESMEGRWTEELAVIISWLNQSFKSKTVDVHAFKDLAPAAVFYSALHDNINTMILEEAPLSYLFDAGVTDNFYSMGIHVPGILPWGDLSLASALSNAKIKFVSPRTIAGHKIKTAEMEEFKKEFDHYQKETKSKGDVKFDL